MLLGKFSAHELAHLAVARAGADQGGVTVAAVEALGMLRQRHLVACDRLVAARARVLLEAVALVLAEVAVSRVFLALEAEEPSIVEVLEVFDL